MGINAATLERRARRAPASADYVAISHRRNLVPPVPVEEVLEAGWGRQRCTCENGPGLSVGCRSRRAEARNGGKPSVKFR